MSLPPPRKKPSSLPPPKPKKHSIHIQQDLMELADNKPKSEYTGKILAPIYEPKNKKPHILELLDQSKSKKLIRSINESKLPKEEKAFLIEAAKRHNVFNYKKVADYYAHSSREMQTLMEDSALIIIDFDDAIRLGYVKFSEEIKKLYVEEYEKQS